MGDTVVMQLSGFGRPASAPAASPSPSPEDFKDWITIYPAYICKTKTKQEGRRIQLERALEPMPLPVTNDSPLLVSEIGNACGTLRYRYAMEVCLRCVSYGRGTDIHYLQNKLYSRDAVPGNKLLGRVRVNIKNEDGTRRCTSELISMISRSKADHSCAVTAMKRMNRPAL